MSMCKVISCVVERGCLLRPLSSLGRVLLAFALLQFSSVQLCPSLRDPMNRSMPGLPAHHQLPEFT